MRKALPILFAAALAAPALAHHSFAMFDPANVKQLDGEVTEFRWVNPHVALFVKTDGAKGPVELWALELTSPSNLKRRGFTRTSFKPGDKVRVQLNPLRDGRHGGGFRSAELIETGTVYGAPLIDIERNGS